MAIGSAGLYNGLEGIGHAYLGVADLVGPILYAGMVVGDSFSEGPATWVTMLHKDAYSYAVDSYQLVAHIEPAFTADLADAQANFPATTYCIIQGGFHDVNAGVSSNPNIQAATTTMINEANAAGLAVIVLGIAPWKNGAGWSAGDQTETDAYNAWLAANEVALSYTYVDIYSELEDATADELEGIYDSGDGIHPNAAGHRIIAGLVDTAVEAL